MTRNDSYASEDSSKTASAPTTTPPAGADVGCRAADLSADRYVELEHEYRASRFARAITQAQGE